MNRDINSNQKTGNPNSNWVRKKNSKKLKLDLGSLKDKLTKCNVLYLAGSITHVNEIQYSHNSELKDTKRSKSVNIVERRL